MIRTQVVGLMLGTLTAAGIGCGGGDAGGDEAMTVDQVQEELVEAGRSAGELLAQERREFGSEIQSRLDELDAQIEALGARIAEAGDEAAERGREEMEALRSRAAEARAELEELTDESAGAWDDIKEGMTDALAELERAYENASSSFES